MSYSFLIGTHVLCDLDSYNIALQPRVVCLVYDFNNRLTSKEFRLKYSFFIHWTHAVLVKAAQ